MSTSLVFLAEGFEETEAVGTIDILKRGGVETMSVSVTDTLTVKGAHGLGLVADKCISDVDLSAYDALVLPGGMPGTVNLGRCRKLTDALVAQYRSGKIVAAICAAPTVLGALHIADGRTVTCYPGCEGPLAEADVTGSEVEADGNVITGRGPGTVFDFAVKIVEKLEGNEKAASVAEGLTIAERLGY